MSLQGGVLVVQPISLVMAHFNVEHSAQISKDAIAAAQQTGQGQEVAQESVRRTQTVQASMASAEAQKVHRRSEDDERERRREERQFASPHASEDEAADSTQEKPEKSFDLYA